ncbi:MAG: hypothetical protein NC181_00465 [Clostridium sp.]|nr:hypothetical protein [Clostridium sp.]MCM1443862.1 hypothetical protein [Candidatus Amulumruptor caecigallinarius]
MKKSKSKFTEDQIPVKNILNGMIVLDSDEKVTGVKIEPKNIFIMEQESQNAIISNLKDVYNQIDYEFWIIVADRPVDINLYLSSLQLQYNSISDVKRRQLIIADINKANMFMSNNIVDTEYYLLFKHKDNEVIQKRIRNLIAYFANAGLITRQTSNEDLRIILDNFLNGGQTTTLGTVIS